MTPESSHRILTVLWMFANSWSETAKKLLKAATYPRFLLQMTAPRTRKSAGCFVVRSSRRLAGDPEIGYLMPTALTALATWVQSAVVVPATLLAALLLQAALSALPNVEYVEFEVSCS